jgi:hypothetical protein
VASGAGIRSHGSASAAINNSFSLENLHSQNLPASDAGVADPRDHAVNIILRYVMAPSAGLTPGKSDTWSADDL